MKKHLFMYVTDNLMAHVSYKQTWELWLASTDKSEDDWVMSSMEANTNQGQIYYSKMAIWLSDDEFKQFLPDTNRA